MLLHQSSPTQCSRAGSLVSLPSGSISPFKPFTPGTSVMVLKDRETHLFDKVPYMTRQKLCFIFCRGKNLPLHVGIGEICPAEWGQQFWKSECSSGMHSAGVLLLKSTIFGNTMVVQWLELCAFTAEDPGSVCGRGTKIPQAIWYSRRKKQKAPSSSSPSLSELMSNPDPLRGPMVSAGLLLL